jgi:hypothetical protein
MSSGCAELMSWLRMPCSGQVSVGELWSAHILDASLTKIVRDATARMCPLAYVAQARCSMNAHFLSFTCAMRKVLKSMAT